jgi:hypothetical protein
MTCPKCGVGLVTSPVGALLSAHLLATICRVLAKPVWRVERELYHAIVVKLTNVSFGSTSGRGREDGEDFRSPHARPLV